MGVGDWLRRLFRGAPRAAEPASAAAPAEGDDANGPVWCVVANVVRERRCGPGGAEVRRGTKHFAPGAKVHVFRFYWGMGGEAVTVVGRHRKSRRYVTITMRAARLANRRAELAYSPHVIGQILEYGEFARLPRGGDAARTRAERIAADYLEGGAVRQPFTTRPPSD